MAEHIDDRRRQVVPRWWPFQVAATLGQLDAAVEARTPSFPEAAPGEVEELRRDWLQNRTPIHAANLVDAALILGNSHVADDAAEWLIKNGGISKVSIDLAQQLLSPPSAPEPSDLRTSTIQARYKAITTIRYRLRRFPRDPLLWVDLAREYLTVGQLEPTQKALLIAINLAPNNRFVLRSASRFFLHIHDPEQAHHVLHRAACTSSDPWLVAAEVVAAREKGSQSRLVKDGVRLLESKRFHPRHISELASAIGTLEHEAGKRKQVRKLFAHALVAPTENSVAQAAWVSRHMPDFELPDSSLGIPRAFEAWAWEAIQSSDFINALSLSQEWLQDEPFSTRPALLGSWIAYTALGDYNTALSIIESAMIANPDDPHLLVQMICCQASTDNIDKAESLIPKLERLAKKGEGNRTMVEWDVVINADRGLIAFRRGRIDEGRAFYEKALEIAVSNRLFEAAASAYIHYAREQALVDPTKRLDVDALDKAVEVFHPAIRGVIAIFVQRIKESVLSRRLSVRSDRLSKEA